MTEYDSGWVGRYQGIKTELVTVDINPSISWRVNECLALGGGLSAQHGDAELTSAVDFGGILAGFGSAGAAPQALDGRASMEGDGWGYGFNLGLLYTPRPSSRIGLAFRSSISHTLEGEAKFRVPPPATALNALGLFVDTDAEADVDLPESASIGYAEQIAEKWTVLCDVAWTRWSRFEELRIDFDSPQPDSVTEEDWDDTWRAAFGLNYACNDTWTLRCGTMYDECPIPDKEHRTPRIPDGDRIWLAVGAGYQAGEDLVVDLSYAHLFFDDVDIDHTGTTGDRLVGTYEGEADILSVQLNWRL
jgi:long-chain fatty acid transport protein